MGWEQVGKGRDAYLKFPHCLLGRAELSFELKAQGDFRRLKVTTCKWLSGKHGPQAGLLCSAHS